MGTELDVMKSMSKVLIRELESNTTEFKQDEDVLFGKLVAAEMKNFSERIKFRMKHQINNLIFNAKVQQDEAITRQNTATVQSTRCAAQSSALPQSPVVQLCAKLHVVTKILI